MQEKFEIYYVRHADTHGAGCGDRDKCDVDITELGEKQIELISKRLEGMKFDAVFSSPLVRCIKTAAGVCKRLDGHPEIEIMPELIERGSTENYAGCSISYLSQYYDRLKECEDIAFGEARGVFPNVTKSEAMERGRALAKYFCDRFTYGQKIIVFSHACFGNSFIPSAVGIREEDFIMTLMNTSLSKIKFTPDGVKRISFQNDISHLRPLMPNYEEEL